MEIIKVELKEFLENIVEPYIVYSKGEFAHLNKEKADEIHFFLFKEKKIRLGLILGSRDNVLLSPFSAPFGGFVFINRNVKIEYLESAVDLLVDWSKTNGYKKIVLKLPPSIYSPIFINKQLNVLFRKNFKLIDADLNYYFKTKKINDSYSTEIWSNARKSLKISLNNNLSFLLCNSIDEKKEAYQVIEYNRSHRGFPLRMSWNDVFDTVQLIKADFFLCKHYELGSIAAAMVFYVATDIVQIIYWGDKPEYSNLKTMNFLSFELFKYYKSSNIKIVDIGPSTENSIPNYGLCDFKESIGCDIDSKFTLSKEII